MAKKHQEHYISIINNVIVENNLPLKFIGFIDFESAKKSGNTKIHFFCTECNDEITSMSIDNFKKNRKCSGCSKRTVSERFLKPLPHYLKLIDDEILFRNVPYICKGTTNFIDRKNTKIDFFCTKHDIPFSMSIDNFLRGKGCYECGKERTTSSKVKSLDEHIQKFVNLHGEKYSYDKFIWVNNQTNCTITCKVHNYDFQKTPANFRRTVEHCPLCNGEVDINTLPTQLYVQSIVKDGLNFGKFGISLDTHRRMTQQQWKSGAEHQVLTTVTCNTRTEALKLEKLLKESIPSGFVDSSVLPDGHTETFDAQYLNIVLEIVNSFNSKEED